MKIRLSPLRSRQAYILVLTMIFLGLVLLFLAGAMSWSSQNTRNTDRGNEYYTTAAAAEAATEKVLVRIGRDYILGGEGYTFNNLPTYCTLSPNNTDNAYWGNYTFSAPPNNSTPGLSVTRIAPYQFTLLNGEFAGLFGNRATYRIAATAELNSSRYGIKSSVWQDVGVESIPLFQFAIFYNMDLEIEPSPAMIVTGKVHSNSNIYVMPSTSLVFSNDVSAVGNIDPTFMPGDTGHTQILNPNITYLAGEEGGQSSLNLPIGTNNSTTNIYALLQIPPGSESALSAMGTNRFYNKADVIILVSNTSVTVTSGVNVDNQATVITNAGPNSWTNFLNTNVTFLNERENKTILTTQFDVSQFRTWAESSSNVLKGKLQGKTTANIVYIADMRTSAVDEPGVRLINGSELPNNGLTVATPDPVYIKGDYNTTTNGVSYSTNVNNTTYTYPASVIGDAISILSNGWSDSTPNDSSNSKDTTVNAAFLSGIVPTTSTSYSGGVENYPRFLENWTGKNFWYNGSMVVMFNSQIAKAPWNNGSTYYSPPARHWAFDVNFYNEGKLPPGTPQILLLERLHWAMMPFNANPSDTNSFFTNYSSWPIL